MNPITKAKTETRPEPGQSEPCQSEPGQAQAWQGEFGNDYRERNRFTTAELDTLYVSRYGISRTVLNTRFLNALPRNARVLEVGCNIGIQLSALEQMGFSNLYGIEINSETLKEARTRLPAANLVQGTALEIPYPEGHFDLVFTSGLLIHIAPSNLATVMSEIHRCAKRWIWGAEYYAPAMTEIPYRGNRNLLWKADYARLYMESFPDLELVREERLPYLKDANIDTMFLLSRVQ